jgi:hypothetical protein
MKKELRRVSNPVMPLKVCLLLNTNSVLEAWESLCEAEAATTDKTLDEKYTLYV